MRRVTVQNQVGMVTVLVLPVASSHSGNPPLCREGASAATRPDFPPRGECMKKINKVCPQESGAGPWICSYKMGKSCFGQVGHAKASCFVGQTSARFRRA